MNRPETREDRVIKRIGRCSQDGGSMNLEANTYLIESKGEFAWCFVRYLRLLEEASESYEDCMG